MTDRDGRNAAWVPAWMPEAVVFALTATAIVVLIAVPYPVDPMNYLEAAQNPLASEATHWTTRIGLIFPVWMTSLVFGYSEVALYAVPVVAAAGLATATAWTGRLMFNRLAGVGAAILVAVSPFVLPYASQVLPDIGAAAMVTAAFGWAAKLALRSEEPQRGAWVVGIIFGYAYLVRETSLLYFPALIVFAVILGLRGKAVLAIIWGSLAVAATEALVALVLWGDPLARIHAIQQRSYESVPSPREVLLTNVAMQRQNGFGSSAAILVELLTTTWHGRMVIALTVMLSVGAVIYRSRRLFAILAWVVIPWALFAVLGSLRPEPDTLFIRLGIGRYWAAQMPPMVLGGLGVASQLVSRLKDWRWRAATPTVAVSAMVLAGAIAGFATSFGSYSDFYVRFGNDQFWEMRESLAALPGDMTLDVRARYQALFKLYANDPLGRQVFDGEIRSGGETPSNGVILELTRSASTADQTMSTISEWSHLRLSGVDDGLRWAILTADPAPASSGDTLYKIESDWQGRQVVGEQWGAPEDLTPNLLDLDEGESVVVFDGSSGYGTPNPEQVEPVRTGDMVLGLVETEIGGGRVEVMCDFFAVEDPDQRLQVRAFVSLTHTEGGDALISVCETPEGGAFLVRPVLTIVGPAKAVIGTGFVSSVPGPDSSVVGEGPIRLFGGL